MAIFNATGQSAAGIINNIAGRLVAHRDALTKLNEAYAWASGISAADLTAAPINMTSADANAILSAVADAHAEYLIHLTGQAPGSYPQVPAPYPYANSQTTVIGLGTG